MFTTPSEARSSGFMGNWGILTLDHGTLDLTRLGRTEELNAAGATPRTISGPADFLARYGPYQPEQDWRSVTMSPDFPTVAEVAGQLAPQSGLGTIDGVIAVDPEGIAALLELTGPISVPGRAAPLTAENAAEFLLRGQYEELSNPTRIDYLEEAAHAVTDRLTHGSLPGLRTIGNTLGAAVQGGHLLLHANDPTSQRLFRRLGASGTLAPAAGDYVGLTTQNWSGNKIELFLHRSLHYDVRVDPSTGEERATATITLANRAPTSGEPDYVIRSVTPTVPIGANRSVVSFYTSLTLDRATVQGQPVELTGQTERGMNVYTTTLTIPSGATAHLRLELQGGARARDHERHSHGAPHRGPPGDGEPRPRRRAHHRRGRMVARSPAPARGAGSRGGVERGAAAPHRSGGAAVEVNRGYRSARRALRRCRRDPPWPFEPLAAAAEYSYP